MSSPLNTALASLRPAEAFRHKGLIIQPFTATREITAEYTLLGPAVAAGRVRITEVDQAGTVSALKAVNDGPDPVLGFDGDELVGAKQNRVLNTTVLIGVGACVLPVSCVEQGRWHFTSPTFAVGEYTAQPALRREKAAQVRERLRASIRDRDPESEAPQHVRAMEFRSDQGAVWAVVQENAHALGTHSSTGALTDAYRQRRDQLQEYVGALRDLPAGCAATAVFSHGEFVCLDALWPSPRFVEHYPRLLRGYAMDHLEGRARRQRRRESRSDAEATALRVLAHVSKASEEHGAGVDLGTDLRLDSESVGGAGLYWGRRLIQLSVYPKAALSGASPAWS